MTGAKRHTYCHCEERSDEAIPAVGNEIAALRSQ